MELKKLVNNNSDYEVREQTFNGVPHIVVPVVMMREGVHAGSHGALFHQASELGKYPAAWNGIPVVVYHPQKDGMAISANVPEVLENEKVGTVFNSHMDGDKLKAEVWIDKTRAQAVSPDTLQRILNKQPLDVSVGVFADERETEGEWNGESYHSIAYNHRPDHLALLPDMEGACNWNDGCGIRNNQKYGNMSENELQINAENRGTAIQQLKKQGFPVRSITVNEAGYKEILSRVQKKLNAMDTDTTAYYLRELYDDRLVYEVERRDETAKLYSREYEKQEDGSIEFKGEPTPVMEKRSYEPINQNGMTQNKNGNSNGQNCCPEKVQGLIDNARTNFSENDKNWLSSLNNEQLEKLEPTTNSNPQNSGEPEKSAEEKAKETLAAYEGKPEDLLNVLPENMATQVKEGLKLQENHRNDLVTKITTNSQEFTKEELEKMDTGMLEKISKTIQPATNYSGMGAGTGSTQNNASGDDDDPMLPVGVSE